jgi:branched-chain amino acid transport system ATP-binding protein
MSNTLLELRAVHAQIGAYHILHGVDFTVPKGQLTMLLGRNGAGKTTTLRTIMGLTQMQGAVTFEGSEIGGLKTPQIAVRGIAYVPESMGIFSDLTVAENLLLAARNAKRLSDLDADRLGKIFSLFPAIKKFWNSPAGKLSGGQKQMLAISRAIVEPRQLLIIDEPTKGLAPAVVNSLVEVFSELKRSGVTILLVEQNVHFARRVGDTVAVMDGGCVVYRGSMNAFAADEGLQHSLVGLAI